LDYIVLDIEFNGRKFASELPMEVIEIGAVRLNESLEQIDTFSAFIKPIYFAKLNSFIQKKTGITQAEIDTAKRFPKVIEAFQRWLSSSNERLFITWGKEDMKRIILDTRMHKLDDQYWMTTPYFDLLKGFTALKGLNNDISVEGALELLQIESNGQAHRALDDALMTAEIFRAIYSGLNFAQQQYYVDMYTNARERRALKNAVRMLRAQKVEPTWDNYVTRFIKDKIDGLDQRKLDEMKQYFEKEAAKPVKAKSATISPVVEQSTEQGRKQEQQQSTDALGDQTQHANVTEVEKK